MKTTTYRIKAEYGYYAGTYNAPQDGYVQGEERYDGYTGRNYTRPLEFGSVKEAYDHLTAGERGGRPIDGLATEYNRGYGNFSVSGTYYAAHGQHTRPFYTIVSAKSGRCTKEIVAECERIAAQGDASKAAAALGRIKTPAKAQAARENGKKGGRPANKTTVLLFRAEGGEWALVRFKGGTIPRTHHATASAARAYAKSQGWSVKRDPNCDD